MKKNNRALVHPMMTPKGCSCFDPQTITKEPYENSASAPNIPSTGHKEG